MNSSTVLTNWFKIQLTWKSLLIINLNTIALSCLENKLHWLVQSFSLFTDLAPNIISLLEIYNFNDIATR